MASHARPAPPAAIVLPIATLVRHGIAIAIVSAIVIRLAALVLFDQPLASDGLAYFTMAKSFATTGVMIDPLGHHAFYSPGYPLLLTPFFALFGASAPVALFVNLGLAGVSAALTWRLARALGGSEAAAALAALGYAMWLPSIWSATDLARENLSTPLLLGFAIALVLIAKGNRDWRVAALAGASFGAGLLAGTSVALTAGALPIALWFGHRRRLRAMTRPVAIFAATTLFVLTPWFAATTATLGRPVLTTNGPFNLYIGNNPAATGQFVSIAQTPIAADWHGRVDTLGELGIADWLGGETRTWVAAHPGRALMLSLKKLALFWSPNVPDRADFAAAPLVAGLRLLDLVQWAAILSLAGLALFRRDFDRRLRWTIGAIVLGFWTIHGATYIIPRYRDPIMPILIALAATEAARQLRRIAVR